MGMFNRNRNGGCKAKQSGYAKYGENSKHHTKGARQAQVYVA